MKIAATTLATPNADLSEMLKECGGYGYEGLELRGIRGQMYLTKVPEFSDANISKTMKMIKDSCMDITCLSLSTSFVGAPQEKLDAYMQEGRDHIELAGKLGVPRIRVFGGDIKEMTVGQAVEKVAKGLKELAPLAKKNNVKIMLETHDAFSVPQNVVDTVKLVNDPSVGVCWDICNSYKAGWDIKKSADLMGHIVDYVHVKDNDGEKYVLFGKGKVHNELGIKLLMEKGYDGWLCVEWEKKWFPDIVDAKIALPQYIKELKRIIG